MADVLGGAADIGTVSRDVAPELARAFILWVLSDGQKLEAEVGHVPLTEQQLAEAHDKLK